ncbi:trypsin-like serine protease [Streptomyces sp. NBC_00193]|uniref:trypsin-like serine peptidase n=1 Tax=unclassified Streptomyces TaxID=2593676 RepID=UPI00224C7E74|nr:MULTISPECIES: trypsin-like serine protease [unclassified Streptomyces]MCX5129874.1 trypsin-like serine protease [Streptomyces sp. NBC_00347]MCX5300445.1 trypsin-like serine protease [Streptomyces sp. NBC_00193]
MSPASAADVRTVVHDGAVTGTRGLTEMYWTSEGIAAVAVDDAKDDLVQPEWTGDGSIARTVGRLYASGTDGSPSACTATVVGVRTVVTAAHCVRTPVKEAPSSEATWDRNLYFVPGYRRGTSPNGGFTVRRIRMAENWQADGLDVAMLEMNPGVDGRNISEATGAQPISFTGEQATTTHFFGYPYTDRLVHCSGAGAWEAGKSMRSVPCMMGAGSSGGPYLAGEYAAGSVIAVNVSGGEGVSYGTALGAFAERLYQQSEHG